MRGRVSTNLYVLEGEFSEALLSESVGSLKKRLQLKAEVVRPHFTDIVLFSSWSLLAVMIFALLPLAVILKVFV